MPARSDHRFGFQRLKDRGNGFVVHWCLPFHTLEFASYFCPPHRTFFFPVVFLPAPVSLSYFFPLRTSLPPLCRTFSPLCRPFFPLRCTFPLTEVPFFFGSYFFALSLLWPIFFLLFSLSGVLSFSSVSYLNIFSFAHHADALLDCQAMFSPLTRSNK